MKDITLISKSLYSKIEKLVHLHDKCKEENKKLLLEKQKLIKQVANYETTIKGIEDKVFKEKLASALSKNNDQTTDTKLKINELVREIDKCIALLNK